MTGNPFYLSLCYHYIRSQAAQSKFPRILGNSEAVFRSHLNHMKTRYHFISLEDALRFSKGAEAWVCDKPGMLITFDDGLTDHYLAAKILHDYGIKAAFFISTCVFSLKEPANPTIIHYALARHGVGGFLDTYHKVLEKESLEINDYRIPYTRGKDDPWKAIGEIKNIFKYKLGYDACRRILLSIYRDLLLNNDPDIFQEMHLSALQVREMLAMGHSIGVHTHSHVSVAATDLTPQQFDAEVVAPKRYLENTFGIKVHALSYPFGEIKDCLSFEGLISKTKDYEMAFTVEQVPNTRHSSPFELGRYMPHSQDDANGLLKILDTIQSKLTVVG